MLHLGYIVKPWCKIAALVFTMETQISGGKSYGAENHRVNIFYSEIVLKATVTAFNSNRSENHTVVFNI